MKISERIVWIFIVTFLCFLIYYSCKHQPGSIAGPVSIQTIKTIDTIRGDGPVSYVPSPAVHDTIHDSIPYPEYVTLAEDYFPPDVKPEPIKVNTYRDTLYFDSLGYAVVRDTIAGKILKRGFDFNIFRPTITVTKTEVIPPKNKLFLGLEYNYPVNYLGAAAAFQFKKHDNILKVSAGYINGKLQYGAGYFVKVKF